MTLSILNDGHIGTERIAGTTLESRWQLRKHLVESFGALLPIGGDLMILGDLFDAQDIQVFDVLRTYDLLVEWLHTHPASKLYLVAGNHDLSKTSNVLGSFDLLGSLLTRYKASHAQVIKKPCMTPWGYVIPHLANQALFDAALLEVPECKFLYLHVNYDNYFATQSDQSLNLSAEQLEALPVQRVICGHEHNYRSVPKLLIPGNQVASSVSDWVHSPVKYMTVVLEDLSAATEIAVAIREREYIELQWDNLVPTEAKFVRVVGSATTEQASQVVSLIAKFRAESSAFIVSNAVQIASESGTAAFSDSLEGVRAFDVWNALGDHLDDSQIQTLKELK